MRLSCLEKVALTRAYALPSRPSDVSVSSRPLLAGGIPLALTPRRARTEFGRLAGLEVAVHCTVTMIGDGR